MLASRIPAELATRGLAAVALFAGFVIVLGHAKGFPASIVALAALPVVAAAGKVAFRLTAR